MTDIFPKLIERVLVHEGELVSAMARALEAESRRAGLTIVTADPKNSRNYGCSQDGCVRIAYAGGMCNAHYLRSRARKDMAAPIRATRQGLNCSVCGDPKDGKGGWGLCSKHYKKKRRYALKAAAVQVMGGKCSACLKSFPLAAYDFHHVSNDKEASPSFLFEYASTEAIAAELVKCALLCANCHRIEHSDEL